RWSEEDSIEQERVATRGSAGEGEGWGTSASGWRGADEGELPTSQAAVEALPGGWSSEAQAWECRAKVQPGAASQTAPEDSAEGRGKIRGLWADAGGGASGHGRRAPSTPGDVAALDAHR